MARVLVAYASKFGSTAEVAQEIGARLCARGEAVDVRPVKEVTDLSPYGAVVIGSAINAGKWLPEATAFVESNRERLSAMPVALFTVCMTLHQDTPENRATVAGYTEALRAGLRPVSEGLFAGVVDYGKMPLLARLLLKAMKTPAGDFRDWAAIRAWADGVFEPEAAL